LISASLRGIEKSPPFDIPSNPHLRCPIFFSDIRLAPMKQNYLIAPLITMAAFAGYYAYWKSQPHPTQPVESRPADPYATRDGKAEAEALIASGKLVFLESGPGVSWDAERREIARTKYGIELRRVEGATEGFVRYLEAFNRVMRPQISSRFGRGFFNTLHEEAIALHEARASKKG
jgi:hypothetical protein